MPAQRSTIRKLLLAFEKIPFMSKNAFSPEWVELERNTALFRDPTNRQRRFIPLRLDDCDIKGSLRQFAYVD